MLPGNFLLLLVAAVVIASLVVCAPFFGYRFTIKGPRLVTPFPLPTVRGARILPISLIALGVFGFLLYRLALLLPKFLMVVRNVKNDAVFWSHFGFGLGVVLLLVLFVFAPQIVLRFPKSETWKLIKVWLKAKKERVCPVLQVVE